jgi:hypothetical protein
MTVVTTCSALQCSVCNVSVASTGAEPGRSLTEVVAAGIEKLEPVQEAD